MKVYDAKPSFAAGEISPFLYGRVDMDRYAVGARLLENFIVLPQGGILNRPGTRALVSANSSAVRLVPFIFSEEDAYCLEVGDGYARVLSFSGIVATISGSPYATQHLSELRWLQSADVLYFFHRKVAVHALKRYAMNDWRFEAVDFKNGPFQDANTDPGHKMSLRWQPGTSDYILFSTFPFFSVNHIGASFKLVVKVKARSGAEILTTAKPSLTILNWFGPFTWTTTGKWGGKLLIERCEYENWAGKDAPAWVWEEFKTYNSEGGDNTENYSYSGSVDEYSTHFRFTFTPKDSSPMKFNWSFDGGIIQRIVKVVGFWDEQNVIAVPVDKITGDTSETDEWSISAFGPMFGYPALGVFHQERLILASTPHDPQTMWMSRPASWHDFGTSIPAKDDDSITVTLAAKQVNEIRGLASRGALLIFTGGAEWTARAGSKSDVFTPSSIVVTPSGYRGSAFVEPLDVGTDTLFVQRSGQVVRSLSYSLEADDYASGDMSILSSHLFERRSVARWGYQQEPWGLVWVALSDGALLALTIQQEHQVTAWTRQDVGGKVLDVCAIPGDGQDDLFLVVQRGGSTRIEVLQHREDTFLSPSVFTDAGGAPVVSTLETLNWEAQIEGTLQERHRGLQNVTLRLYRTCGLKAGVMTEGNTLLDELRMGYGLPPGPSGTPLSGDFRIPVPGGLGRSSVRLKLMNDRAQPVTITGVFPELVLTSGG